MAKDRPDKEKTLFCSFCGKSQHEVKKLIAGPSVFICDECIALANDIIRDEDSSSKAPTGSQQDLTPEEIATKLGDYVIGQKMARMKLAVAVYNHYVRINNIGKTGDVEIEKSNILMVGPTGSGKTLLAQTLARILNVPFVIADATKMTAAGYVGEDVETMLQKLIANADFDIEKAKRGIVYIDEIDKIARGGDASARGATRDVGGEDVQYGLLKIIEGTIANVPPQGGRKSPTQDFIPFDTRNILFIVGGAFSGLTKLIEKRVDSGGGIGFGAHVVGDAERKDKSRLPLVEPEDLISYGLVPELVGRLHIIATLDELTESDLVRILREPKNALIKQFEWLFARQGAVLDITPEASLAMARLAKMKRTGGRGLRTILENVLLETEFILPGLQRGAKPVKKVVVGEDVITKNVKPALLSE